MAIGLLLKQLKSSNMQTQAFIYTIGGEIIPILPNNNKYFELSELQSIVEGYIEIVYLKDGRLMIVNEEGKFGFTCNQEATKLFDSDNGDYISGNVLVTPRNFIK
jgi:hypothetical protein